MWTKSQKVAGAVLGLAVVAFCVDRFVLSPPAGERPAAAEEFVVKPSGSSSSSSSSDKPAVARSASPARAAIAASTANAMTLASRLQAMGETRRLAYELSGDAFRPSDAWVVASQPKPAAPAPTAKRAAEARAVPKVDHAALFLRRHKLSAVMANQGRGGLAIVDGKMLTLGQTFDGFKLTHVGTADATFTGKGTKVTLKVPGQDVPVASLDVGEAR
jgi:hypothetical protein